MPKIYVLDACAIIASLKNENGADKVENIFISQKKSHDTIIMHKINLLEVYYDVVKRCGEAIAKLANSIALSMAYLQKGILVTSDHHEFDIVEQREKISFYWIR